MPRRRIYCRALRLAHGCLEDLERLLGGLERGVHAVDARLLLVDVLAMALALQDVLPEERHLPTKLLDGGSVGAVAISEWDPNVVYVGLGEKTVRGLPAVRA